jgi:hypothetical protein
METPSADGPTNVRGLLLACAPQRAAGITAAIQKSGYPAARIIAEAKRAYRAWRFSIEAFAVSASS